MFCFPTALRFAVLAIAMLFFFGCAGMSEKLEQYTQEVTQMMDRSDLPEPIATSLDQMPDDAAMVARAIQQRINRTGQRRVQNVRFADNVGTKLAQPWSSEPGFLLTGAQLYVHQAKADNPAQKTTSGRLNFEGPVGRRASVRYDAVYRTSVKGVLIEEAHVTPIYVTYPEPRLFVVPAKALPADANRYPGTYGELLQFVGTRAVDSTATTPVSMEQKDYVIFVFLLDEVSASANLDVKVSSEPSGIYGYKDSTRYVNFGDWRVALLAGRFTLFGDETFPPLFVKAVFTPGEEVGFLSRTPKLVGLYSISGSSP